MGDNKTTGNENNSKKKDNRSFCFCMHAQVDCLPGVVLDCNNHKREVCPLVEEVLAVNKDKEKQVKELKEKFKQKDSKGKSQGHKAEAEQKPDKKEASVKKVSKADEKKSDKKKDNRSFCFCMHAQVDCLPGVVLDCNNHKRKVCPLVEEVLSVNKDKEKQVKELKEKYKQRDSKLEDNKKEKEEITAKATESKSETKKEEKKPEKKKDNRAFCFCLGAQVNCLPGVVLDCNNHKRKMCPVLLEALPFDEEQKEKVNDITVMFDNSKA